MSMEKPQISIMTSIGGLMTILIIIWLFGMVTALAWGVALASTAPLTTQRYGALPAIRSVIAKSFVGSEVLFGKIIRMKIPT